MAKLKLNWIIGGRLGGSTGIDVSFAQAAFVEAFGGGRATFTLQPAPTNGVMVVRQGVVLYQGTQDQGGQYTWSGSQITFNPDAIPETGTPILVFVW